MLRARWRRDGGYCSGGVGLCTEGVSREEESVAKSGGAGESTWDEVNFVFLVQSFVFR